MRPILDTDVLVLGGGISGSALACALRGSEYRVVCLEERTDPLDTARGDHLQPRNVQTLADWGVLDAFLERGAKKRIGHEFRTADGEVLIGVRYDELEIPHPYFLVFRHELIAELFLELATSEGNVTLLRPFSARRIETSGGSIESVTAEGPGGREVTIRAKVVVAADGSASQVRTALDFATFEHPYRRPMVVLFGRRPASLVPEDYFFRYSSPAGVLVIQGRMDGRIKVTLSVGEEGIGWWKRSTPALRAVVLGERAAVLREFESDIAGFYPLRMIHAIDYVSGNTVLVGDAAHSIHPARGQGLNMGLASLPHLLRHLPGTTELDDPPKVAKALLAYQAAVKPLFDRMIARNHETAIEMEMGVEERREDFVRRQDEQLRRVHRTPELRRRHLLEATGYPFGVPGEERPVRG